MAERGLMTWQRVMLITGALEVQKRTADIARERCGT